MDVRTQVYAVTKAIWIGPFASPERLPTLQQGGVTDLLNVGEAPSVLVCADGPFRSVVWRPVPDLALLSHDDALASLNALHQMACSPDALVYVHCIAGRNRSPTVVWLYLIACGLSPEQAKEIIEQRAPDAVPGHSSLVDAPLIKMVREFGANEFLPHPRSAVLDPA